MRTVHNKLIRDRLPAIIAAGGGACECETLDTDAYRAALRAKLVEEAYEAEEAIGDKLLDELADLREVIEALIAAEGVDELTLSIRQQERRQARGAFDDRVFLHWVDEPDR